MRAPRGTTGREPARRQGLARTAAAAAASPWTRPTDRGTGDAASIKRAAVLRAAAQLFNDKGYHATSLDMVAERLSVTKPTLYYYVRSKEEILFECVRLGLELMRAAIAEAAGSGGSALDKLEAAMHEYALIVTMDFGMCLIRVGEDPLAPDSRRKLRRLKAQIDHEFRSLIEQGVAEGSLALCDPKLAAFTLAGALSWIGRWYDPAGPVSAEDVARQSIGLLMHGLSPRPATTARPRPAPRRGAALSAR
jgi:AcrR family transcriptional regulator